MPSQQNMVEHLAPRAVSSAAPSPSLSASAVRVRIPIETDADIAHAGEQCRRLASRLDFLASDVTVIAAAIVEVARNLLAHGTRGDLVLHLIERGGRLGVSIVARDKGPGIANLRQALRDGGSSAGGLGLGLPSARRLMDEFRLSSEPGRGTTVTMRKWARCRPEARARVRGGAGGAGREAT